MKLLAREIPIDYLLVLRGCAALGVFSGHLAALGPISIGAVVTKGQWNYTPHAEPFETWRSVLEILTPLLGLNFVVLFFVQSGFLMGKVFFDRRYDAENGKFEFYWARYLRLAPLLYVNLVVCAFFYKYADVAPLKLAADFLFLNNFTGPSVNGVTWSLSHEMQYYLVAPFVFMFCKRHIGWLLAAIAAAFVIGQFAPPFGYTYAFLVGFGVNLMPKRIVTARAKHVGLIVGLLVLHLGFNSLMFAHFETAAVLLATIASAALVYVCEQQSNAPSSMLLRWGVLTGYLTFGFYLWHYVVIRTFTDTILGWTSALTDTPWAATMIFHGLELVTALPVSYGLAWLSFVFIESRFRPGLYAGVHPSRASS